MRAAVIATPGRIAVREVPEPVPGDYDALCELLYGATCSATDRHIIDGCFPWISPLPTILGHESVGRVVKVGPKVRHYRVGDLVTRVGTPPVGDCSVTWGGFAEFGLARDHWAMARDGAAESAWSAYRVNQVIPHGIDPRSGPMFVTWRETLSYLLRCGVTAASRVLVVGSGGNGLAFAAHAVNLGCRRVVVVGNASRRQVTVDRLKVHAYHDYRAPGCVEAVLAGEPEGFDIVFDALGRTGVGEKYLPALRADGTFAVYGIDDIGSFTIPPFAAGKPFTFRGAGPYDEAETHHAVCELVMQGKLRAEDWYDLDGGHGLGGIDAAFAELRTAQPPVKLLVQLRGG